ncbi:MAG TPA: cyanophycin synthetase, partial [Verrucomicrobiae bacterium]|nr:cyanophycin synthetase [Verrucomicrobiae bacterium]
LGPQCFRFNLRMIGRGNLEHLMAACAAALALGLTSAEIAGALPKLLMPPGALEAVTNERGLALFVDEARDEESLENVLSSLREITPGRIFLVFGASENTTGKQRFNMGQIAAQYVHHAILTSDNPGREGVEQICSAIAQGLESAGKTDYHFQPDRAEAIAELIGMGRLGDVLLISGKGARNYQEFASTITPFDDRLVAVEVLERLISPQARSERPVQVPV